MVIEALNRIITGTNSRRIKQIVFCFSQIVISLRMLTALSSALAGINSGYVHTREVEDCVEVLSMKFVILPLSPPTQGWPEYSVCG